MFFRSLALSLLLFSLGARPAESAIITLDGQTPYVVLGGGVGSPSWLTDAIFGDAMRVIASGGFFDISGAGLASIYTTDARSMTLLQWNGSQLLSATIGANYPFFVNGTSYQPGNYTLDGGFFNLSWGDGFPTLSISPHKTLTVYTVTVQTVPEPSLTMMALLGGTWLVRRSWTRRRGRAAVP